MLEITIKKGTCFLTACYKNRELFDFDYREQLDAWLFWVPERYEFYPYKREGKVFPWELFSNLCRVTFFLNVDDAFSPTKM